MERILYLFIAFGMPLSSCFAAEETENIRSALKTTGYEPNYFSIVLSLVFVIFLIYVTGILYTKLNNVGIKTVKKELKSSTDIKPVVLSTTPIGHDKTLQVIEIAGEKLLIGVSQNSVTLLKSLGYNAPNSTNIQKEKIEEYKEESEILTETTKTREEHTVNAEDFGLYKKYLR